MIRPIGLSPRAGGGERVLCRGPLCQGLSLRARGRASPGLDCSWFIPARAGKGGGGRVGHRIPQVYPRARGKGGDNGAPLGKAWGLSPRARERGPSSRDATVLFRFIPARAGEGGNAGHLRQVVTVYPRACWWKAGAAARRAKDPPVPTAVSPVYPRARGGSAYGAKAGDDADVRWVDWSIRARRRRRRGLAPDTAILDLSPRVPGKSRCPGQLLLIRRFIPARVGKARRKGSG